MKPVVLTGFDLSLADLSRVARDDARVALDRAALARMRDARRVVDESLARGELVYGTNTGVAAKKRTKLAATAIAAQNRLLVESHRVGQGPLAARDVVRATLVCIANGFARGTTTASPELADRVIEALNRGVTPPVRLLGSIGVSDLAPNADLAHAILSGYELRAGEALAFISNAGFSSALAALAVSDATRLLYALEVAGALDLEAFAANLSIVDPAVAAARPHAGARESARVIRELLAKSFLYAQGAARNLQDPLTFRGMPQLFGAARDAFGFVHGQVAAELNASSDNPLVARERRRIIPNWNGEIASLAMALDFARIALAPVLTAATERVVKLLSAPLSGLPGGLAARSDLAEDGLAELGIAAQAFAAEARLLAQPVSFEIASSSHAEGIEDRTTMTPLAARRLAEMVSLGERLCAIELFVAAQAVDLRREGQLGRGTARAYAAVRSVFGFVGEGEAIPPDLEPLVATVRAIGSGGQARPSAEARSDGRPPSSRRRRTRRSAR